MFRSVLTSIVLYGLLTVSALSVIPVELLLDVDEEKVAFFEEDSEGEKESKKKKEEKEEREKTEQKTQKAKKHLVSSRIFEMILLAEISRSTYSLSTWEAPVLNVISPPPEFLLG